MNGRGGECIDNQSVVISSIIEMWVTQAYEGKSIKWVDEDATAWKVYEAEIISASRTQTTDLKSAHNLF